jgi:hypothetical protein
MQRSTSVATSAVARAKESSLPKSKTVTIHNQCPNPYGEVEVTPHAGLVHFKNKDHQSYRLRFWKVDTDSDSGIDILLPANGRTSVVIRKGDAFFYAVLRLENPERIDEKMNPGPIKN